MSLFQHVPTFGAELLWITASHDLLLAEHTLHTVGEGERGCNIQNYKKVNFEKMTSENIYNATTSCKL